ncbi:hypothetical protein EDD16DRAFT_18055 [Pisolithus croceorrhizus]|nr:hypothetical protein EDD16DRAFT_18055 [Pisolithus croceorrhizus]KAI6159552.1 hypothetical protein EDD17DRAFT_1611173 [Pisolithus thermaeus]
MKNLLKQHYCCGNIQRVLMILALAESAFGQIDTHKKTCKSKKRDLLGLILKYYYYTKYEFQCFLTYFPSLQDTRYPSAPAEGYRL